MACLINQLHDFHIIEPMPKIYLTLGVLSLFSFIQTRLNLAINQKLLFSLFSLFLV